MNIYQVSHLLYSHLPLLSYSDSCSIFYSTFFHSTSFGDHFLRGLFPVSHRYTSVERLFSFTLILTGEGIGFHLDTHSSFIGGVCTVSLGSDSVMEFRKVIPPNVDKVNLPPSKLNFGKMELLDVSEPITQSELHLALQKSVSNSKTVQSPSSNPGSAQLLKNGGMIVSRHFVVLRQGSACCFDDEFRFAYEHGIASRSTDCIDGVVSSRSRRVSITLRTVCPPSSNGCQCDWALWCDTQNPVCHRPPTRLKRK